MRYEKITLPNGLRVLLAPMRDTETVTVLVMTGVGSRYEARDLNGMAHFLEHMFFKGTEKRPNKLEISEELDGIGGEYNAYTGKDHTGYYAKVDAKHWLTAVDVVSDIFLHSLIPEDEIERERGAILQEIAMYEDSPGRIVGEVFEALLYGDTPMGWPITGPKENIRKFQRPDFLGFLNEHYTAENVVVGIAGKIDAEKARAEIEKRFAHMPVGAPTECTPVNEAQALPGLLVRTKTTDQTHMVVGVRCGGFFHPDRYVLSTLATILGGGMSSRLFLEVRENRGLAYGVHTSVDRYRDTGNLSTQSGVDHGNLEETLRVILAEYRKITTERVPEKELRKAKEYMKAKGVMHLEASDDVVGFLVDQEVLKGHVVLPDERAKHIDAVTADDIRRVAREIFVPERLNLAVVGPHEANDALAKILETW